MALALCLVLLSLNYSNAQVDSTTGNLVNFTGSPTSTTGNWVNGVYVQQLGCFGGNTPGNCGPYPNVRTNGNINFSYGQVNLNQVVNINNALAEVGAGVQLSGFNFGFRAKNGNGWDDGRQDYLSAYVNIYNSNAKLLEHYDYTQYTNSKYNWSNFNFSETFDKPYNIAKLGAAQFGFIGKDNNYWAGPYGPEITNVSFSLNYRVDPCVANPASSPACPGFMNLIKTPTASISTSTTTLISDTATTGTPNINVGGAQLSNTGTISAPDNIPQALKDIQAVVQQSQSSSTQQQSNKSTPNMSLIMNLIGQIQAADKATQSAAVQNAQQVASTSAAKAQEEANQIVESLNIMSQTSSQSSTIQNNSNIQSSLINQNILASSTNSNEQQSLTPTSSNLSLSVNTNSNNQLMDDTPSLLISSIGNASANDFFANKTNSESLQSEQPTETVKKNVTTNDLAGGVDIASIAMSPKGYEAYSFVLQDSAFYKVEAIYKDQRTVDNARSFRLLSSDRLHQEMVDQQYRR